MQKSFRNVLQKPSPLSPTFDVEGALAFQTWSLFSQNVPKNITSKQQEN